MQVGIPLGSQRLLAILALHGGMVIRAAVAGTLWPDACEGHAYSNPAQPCARGTHVSQGAEASKLELGLAEGVTVNFRHAQALAGGC